MSPEEFVAMCVDAKLLNIKFCKTLSHSKGVDGRDKVKKKKRSRWTEEASEPTIPLEIQHGIQILCIII